MSDAAPQDERYYVTSQWGLIRRRFSRNKLAILGAWMLGFLYFGALFCEFLSPYAPDTQQTRFRHFKPQAVRLFDDEGMSLPFVYARVPGRDPETLQRIYAEDRSRKHYLRLFVHGDEYKLWGFFKTDLHLFGADGGQIFVLGTDNLGRDLLSRILHASRISLTVGLVGVSLSFVLGCTLGGISGYLGGTVDLVIQRVIEILLSIPALPLWMALSTILPVRWSPVAVYFGITVILSFIGWTGLARVVRGKLLQLREEDFVMAARIAGTRERKIITGHLLPSFMSYLIVHMTLAIPGMILGETALSFLGIGLRPPVVSWGTLMSDAQNFSTIAIYPWLLVPGVFVILAVLGFNFLGDGLRDAADPYQ